MIILISLIDSYLKQTSSDFIVDINNKFLKVDQNLLASEKAYETLLVLVLYIDK